MGVSFYFIRKTCKSLKRRGNRLGAHREIKGLQCLVVQICWIPAVQRHADEEGLRYCLYPSMHTRSAAQRCCPFPTHLPALGAQGLRPLFAVKLQNPSAPEGMKQCYAHMRIRRWKKSLFKISNTCQSAALKKTPPSAKQSLSMTPHPVAEGFILAFQVPSQSSPSGFSLQTLGGATARSRPDERLWLGWLCQPLPAASVSRPQKDNLLLSACFSWLHN